MCLKLFVFRFLLVSPSTSVDEQLLADVICFLGVVVVHSESFDVFNWIADALLNSKGAMYQMLTKQTQSMEKDSNDDTQTVRRYSNVLLCLQKNMHMCFAAVTCAYIDIYI